MADAQTGLLLPLRPLTLGEIMDVAFMLIQRSPGEMLGKPLALTSGFGVWAGLSVAGFVLLQRTQGEAVAGVAAALMALVFALLFAISFVWLGVLISRVSARIVLGPGFAPDLVKLTWRQSLAVLPSVLGFTFLAAVAFSVWTNFTGLFMVFVLPFAYSEVAVAVVLALIVGLWVLGFGYLICAVPAYALENASAPGWIGKPGRSTNLVFAFVRSVQLIGWRQAGRCLLLTLGSLSVALVTAAACASGAAVLVWVYAGNLTDGFDALMENLWVLYTFVIGVSVVVLSVCTAFLFSAQTIFYLDLRMRREGLDVAMRFDVVQIPDPGKSGAHTTGHHAAPLPGPLPRGR